MNYYHGRSSIHDPAGQMLVKTVSLAEIMSPKACPVILSVQSGKQGIWDREP